MVSGETGAASLGALRAIGDLTTLGLGPDATVLLISTEGATDPSFFAATVGRDAAAVAADAPPCVAAADRDGPCPVDRCPGVCSR